MSKLKWNDISSYSRLIKEREVNCVETQLGDFRLRVFRHKDYPDTWLAACYGLFSDKVLEISDLEEAKGKAVELVTNKIAPVIKALGFEFLEMDSMKVSQKKKGKK